MWRITASLLHDGDADVGNAEELIGKRPDPARALTHVAAWIPATIGTAYEAAKSIFGIEPRGRVEWIGGPVLEGRKGGTFYVFLPGLPFLLTPSMAVDTFVNPDRLVFTLFTCLLLGTFCTLAIARLVEPAIGSRLGGVGLAFAIGVTPPLFFYHFHVYTEVTATICITLMLIAVLSTRLTLRWAIAFGLSGALLPWLHTKYLPIWGVLLLRLLLERVSIESGMEVVRVGSDTFLSRNGPSVPLRLSHHRQFIARRPVGGERLSTRSDLSQPEDSAGSLLPSSGSRRGTSRLFASLSVCSSRCLGASPAVAVRFRVRPRDRRTVPLHGRVPRPGRLGCLGASRALPRSSRSGDGTLAWRRGCATRRCGGFAGRPLAFVAAAGFWIGQGMLTERHFVYDRSAFLASGVVDPSPVLGSVGTAQSVWQRGAYPVFLVLVFGLVWMWEGRGWRAQPTVLAAAVVAMVVAVGKPRIRLEPTSRLGSEGGLRPARHGFEVPGRSMSRFPIVARAHHA